MANELELDLAINEYDNKYTDDYEENDLFYDACRRGCLSTVLFMIKMEPVCDYNNGLIAACTGGHINIAKLMLEKGAIQINNALRGACEHKHKHTAEFLVSQGANIELLYAFSHDNNWRDYIAKYFYKYDGAFDLPTTGFYDFLLITQPNKTNSLLYIHVKLFDKNIFNTF